jgi:hypothetical protein
LVGEYLAHAVGRDRSIRYRIDVTRFFTQRPGERATVRNVAEHTVGSLEKIRELLEELTGTGWLSTGLDDDGCVVYWKEEVRRGA